MTFTTHHLQHFLDRLSDVPGYLVAFSGGMDSHVLLHAMADLRETLAFPLRALHVDHGLQKESDAWANHCAEVCHHLGVPLHSVTLELNDTRGESLEAVAREARYEVFRDQLLPGELLLTAHHRDDQAETLLLQLLRGAGLSGLAAMPEVTPFGSGRLARPLLHQSRASLERYAQQVGIHWVEDQSNRDTGFDRNYLRHQIMPLLKSRWPGAGKTLARSARHCAEADCLLDELLQPTLSEMMAHDGSLSVRCLIEQPVHRIPALLRIWIRQAGYPMPSTARLSRIATEMLLAAADRSPVVEWRAGEVRRYRDRLYLSPKSAAPTAFAQIVWRGESSIELPAGLGRLYFSPKATDNLEVAVGRYLIRFRKPGDVCRPMGRGVNKRLKQLMQEAGVLPWMRDRIPIVVIDGEIAEVAGLCRCEAAEKDPLWSQVRMRWESPLTWRQEWS